MSLSDRIKPISYLKAHAAEIIRTLGDRPEPLIITQNGRSQRPSCKISTATSGCRESVALLKMLALGQPSDRSRSGAARRGGRCAAS